MEKEKGPEKASQKNDMNHTRRRLLKLALWVPPSILTLAPRTAWAQGKDI